MLLSRDRFAYTTSRRLRSSNSEDQTMEPEIIHLHLCVILSTTDSAAWQGGSWYRELASFGLPPLFVEIDFCRLACSQVRTNPVRAPPVNVSDGSWFRAPADPQLLLVQLSRLKEYGSYHPGFLLFIPTASLALLATGSRRPSNPSSSLIDLGASSKTPVFYPWDSWGPRHAWWSWGKFSSRMPLQQFIYGYKLISTPYLHDFNVLAARRRAQAGFYPTALAEPQPADAPHLGTAFHTQSGGSPPPFADFFNGQLPPADWAGRPVRLLHIGHDNTISNRVDEGFVVMQESPDHDFTRINLKVYKMKDALGGIDASAARAGIHEGSTH